MVCQAFLAIRDMKRIIGLVKPSISWQRNLAAIWFAELVAIVGFSVVSPILPLYVRALGVQDEQGVRLWAGLVFSAHAVTMTIFGPIWGALSDRYGRKVMVERAMFSGAIVISLMGLAQNVQQLAALRCLQGALTGTVTAATRSSPRPRPASGLVTRSACSRWRSTLGSRPHCWWAGWWPTV